jgi:hypothetical protein
MTKRPAFDASNLSPPIAQIAIAASLRKWCVRLPCGFVAFVNSERVARNTAGKDGEVWEPVK